jgi:hypothetical protein
MNERGKLAWKRPPREPLPLLPPMEQWVGIQQEQHKLPAKYEHGPPKGELIKGIIGRPAELLGIPNHFGVQPMSVNQSGVVDRRQTMLTDRQERCDR